MRFYCSHPLFRADELVEEDSAGVKHAARRKLGDELGVREEDVPLHEFTCLGRIHYKAPSNGKWGEHEIDYLLFLKKDVSLTPNPDEVAAVKYFNREQVKELVRKAETEQEGIELSPWFRLVVDHFLFQWWDRVEQGTLRDAVDLSTIHRL